MTARRRYHSGQVTLPVSPNPVKNQNKISILLRKARFGSIAAMQRMHRLKTEKHIYPDRSISTITETTRLCWSPKPLWPERIGRHPMRDTCVRLKTAGLVRRAPSAQQRSSPLINLWLSDAVSQLDGVRTPQEPAHPASDPYYNWSRILPGFHTYLSSPAWGSSRLHSETKFFFFFFRRRLKRFSCPLHPPRHLTVDHVRCFLEKPLTAACRLGRDTALRGRGSKWARANAWPRPLTRRARWKTEGTQYGVHRAVYPDSSCCALLSHSGEIWDISVTVARRCTLQLVSLSWLAQILEVEVCFLRKPFDFAIVECSV